MARTKRVNRSAPRTGSLRDPRLQIIPTPAVTRASRQARSRSPPATPTPIRAREEPGPPRRSARTKGPKQTPQEFIPIPCPLSDCYRKWEHFHGSSLQHYISFRTPAAGPTGAAAKEPESRPKRTPEKPASDVGNIWERKLEKCPREDCRINRKHLHKDDQQYYFPRGDVTRAASLEINPETSLEQEPMETEDTTSSPENESYPEAEPSLGGVPEDDQNQQEGEITDSNEGRMPSFHTPLQRNPAVDPEAIPANTIESTADNILSGAVTRIGQNLASIGNIFGFPNPTSSEQDNANDSGSVQPDLDHDTLRNFDQLSVAGNSMEDDDEHPSQRQNSNEAAENDSEDLYGVSDTSERGGGQFRYQPPPGFSLDVGGAASTGQAGSSDRSKAPEQQNPAQASPRSVLSKAEQKKADARARKSESQRVRRATIASQRRAVSDVATQTDPSLLAGITQQALPRDASVEYLGTTDISGLSGEATAEDHRTLIQLEPTMEEWANFWADPTNVAGFEETLAHDQAQSSRSFEVAGLENNITASTEGNRQRFYEGGGGERLLYNYPNEFHMGVWLLRDDTAVGSAEQTEPAWDEWTHEGEDPSISPNRADPSNTPAPAPAGGEPSMLPGPLTTPPNRLQIPTAERPRGRSYVRRFNPNFLRDEGLSLIGAFRDDNFLDPQTPDNANASSPLDAPSSAMEVEWDQAHYTHDHMMLHHQEEETVQSPFDTVAATHFDTQSDVQQSTSDGSTSDEVDDSDPGNIGWMM